MDLVCVYVRVLHVTSEKDHRRGIVLDVSNALVFSSSLTRSRCRNNRTGQMSREIGTLKSCITNFEP